MRESYFAGGVTSSYTETSFSLSWAEQVYNQV